MNEDFEKLNDFFMEDILFIKWDSRYQIEYYLSFYAARCKKFGYSIDLVKDIVNIVLIADGKIKSYKYYISPLLKGGFKMTLEASNCYKNFLENA